LNLFKQLRILMRFVDSSSNRSGQRRGDKSFLECSHDNRFGCGNYG